MESIPLLEVLARVVAAIGLGAMIGIEREWFRHRAGMRTMILISVGSAGFMLLGVETFARDPVSTTGQAEISRVIQGLIGGIGFIGAGAIIHNRATVYGLTSAACVFCVASIGAACGLGLYAIATVIAVASLFTLVMLRAVETRLFPPPPGGVKRYGEDQGGEPSNGNGANGV